MDRLSVPGDTACDYTNNVLAGWRTIQAQAEAEGEGRPCKGM